MPEICCILVDDEPTARDILQLLIEQVDGIKIIASCKNGLEALEVLNRNTVDLIFLDINMPDMSGISVAKSIPKTCKVIFTTAYRKYAVDGFDLQAVDYLLKPISLERLKQAVEKYKEENTSRQNTSDKDYLVIRSDRKMHKINFAELTYIESLGDYVKFHTTTETIITRETISAIESKLPQTNFLRIHRSFIVSIQAINSYTAEYVDLQNKALPISRSYRNVFLKKMKGE